VVAAAISCLYLFFFQQLVVDRRALTLPPVDRAIAAGQSKGSKNQPQGAFKHNREEARA